MWADSGDMLVCAVKEGLDVLDVQGTTVCSVALDPEAVVGVHIANDKLYVVSHEVDATVLRAYALNGGTELGAVTLADYELQTYGWEDVVWREAPAGERDPGDLCIQFMRESSLFVVDTHSLAVCQVVEECFAYDAETRLFVCYRGINDTYRLYTYPRCTVDDLLVLGEEQLGASGMIKAERTAYGLGLAR